MDKLDNFIKSQVASFTNGQSLDSQPVCDAAAGKSRDESKEIEQAAFKGGSGSGKTFSSQGNLAYGKTSQSHSPLDIADFAAEKPRNENRAVDDTSFAATSGKADTNFGKGVPSEPVGEAATGKTRQETREIEQAAHLGGSGRKVSHSGPVLEAERDPSTP
ncbi:hypothetical protein JCM33374_g2310 [Metschnikowia sp. JCM 33374]|nr:hypothetical protein JCM33374_g2310 [Metschnikowia sp. JCM 33374]